ncbi:MAG: GNAT family N-acetyltransferase [Tissierellia bacterium]|nr:GNAT family N-acetyltransferase [Tissierellia bacterium]
MDLIYKDDFIPSIEDIMPLYEDVGWTAYTKDKDNLEKAINNSLMVLTVWDDKKLVGLARVVGDGYTIIYIQDILVIEDYKRRGIGRNLLKAILDEYKFVRQVVLMTDDTEKTISFYESIGLKKVSDYGIVAFMR